MTKGLMRQVFTVIATLVMITVNILATSLPLNNQDTGEISDRFEVFFTPAGYVFSIWGLIYIALIAFSIYQALPAQRDSKTLDDIGVWYWLSSGANIAWIFLWHYNIFYTTIIAMALLLISLIVIYLRLNRQRAEASPAMKWAVHVPFSIYLGWITVATIANATSLVWLTGWNGFGISAEAWTAIVLAVAVVIALIMAIIHADAAYLLVLVWAFIGIVMKHPTVPLVAGSAGAAAAVVGILAIVSLIPNSPFPLKSPSRT